MSLDQSNPNRVALRSLPAILACFKHHPRALRELRCTREVAEALMPVAAWMREQQLPADFTSARDVAELAGQTAEACAITARPVIGLAKISDFAEWRDEGATVVVADNFTDSADLASVVRSMAAFGSKRLLLSGTSDKLAFDPVLWDESRGALEAVRLIRAPALPGLLQLIESTTVIVGLARGIGRALHEAAPVRAPGRHNLILLSPEGVSPTLQPKVEHLFRFPGTAADHPLSAGDSASILFQWLTRSAKERPGEGRGFLARKRARQAGKDKPAGA